MLIIKKIKKIYNDVFFYIEGGRLLNVNRLVQTSIKIDQKVNNVVQFVKNCQKMLIHNLKKH
jgi:hypothetical protein